MTLALIAFLALLAIAYPQTSPVHPGALALRHGSGGESLECEPVNDEVASADRAAVGRAANFSLLGSYRCRRLVFTSGERNPWIERVLAAETLKAKTLAAALAGRKGELHGPLGVSVHGEAAPELLARVAAIYRVELAGVLGREKVRRWEPSPPEPPYLEVAIRRVDAPDLISVSRLVTARGEPR